MVDQGQGSVFPFLAIHGNIHSDTKHSAYMKVSISRYITFIVCYGLIWRIPYPVNPWLFYMTRGRYTELPKMIQNQKSSFIYADLHNHTTASDGDFTPEQLVEKMASLGIQVVGVTDHDTLAGLEQALAAGKNLQIEVLPGVEVSLCFQRPEFTGSLHLLCYFDKAKLQNSSFVKEFGRVLSLGRGKDLVARRVKKINQVFGPSGREPVLEKELTHGEIARFSSNATRRHFAMALEKNHHIQDRALIAKIIGNSSPAYLPSGIDLSIVAGLVKEFHLVPVLAHPAAGSFPGDGHYKEVLPPVEVVEHLLPDFLQIGLKGLEIYYPGHTREHQELLKSWAHKHNLLITGGSDCHDGILRPPGVAGISRQEYLKLQKEIFCA